MAHGKTTVIFGLVPFAEGRDLPDASLKLIQAVGRLIRAEDDHGIVTLLDNRLRTKGYGRQLLAALPDFSRDDGGTVV